MTRDLRHSTNFVGIDPAGWPRVAVNDANDLSISSVGDGNGGISTQANVPRIAIAAPIDIDSIGLIALTTTIDAVGAPVTETAGRVTAVTHRANTGQPLAFTGMGGIT